MLIAVQLMSFGLLASLFGARERYWPTGRAGRPRALLTIDKGCVAGGGMMALGLMAPSSRLRPGRRRLQRHEPRQLMRLSIPSVVLAAIGLQLASTSFLIELLSQPARKIEGNP